MPDPNGAPARRLDAARALEEQPLGRVHAVLTGLGALAVGMDGLDAQAIGYVAPAIGRSLSLPSASMGVIFSASLLGMMLGAMLFGLLGDRIGRKRVIISCVLLIGIATLGTALAGSLAGMITLRFLTGLGMGGVGPNVYALLSEYAPKGRRAILLMLVTTSFPLGAALGGLIAAHVLPSLGWQSLFWIAGASTTLLAAVLALWLPDSRQQSSEQPRESGFPAWELFHHRRAAMTLAVWCMYFITMLENYFVSNWLPTIGHNAGLSLGSAVRETSLLQFGGVAGVVGFGLLIDRWPRAAMSLAFAGTGVSLLALGLSGPSHSAGVIAALCIGFCVNGTQIGDTFVASVSYPSALRSTGVGWASAIGRIGAICGPILGGLALGTGWSGSAMFLVAAVPALLVAGLVHSLGASLFSVMRETELPKPPEHECGV